MRVQWWLEFLTAFGYTLEYGKGSANGNTHFLSRLSEPATEHNRSGSSSSPPWMMAVPSSSGPAGFALVLYRSPVLAWVGGAPHRQRCLGGLPLASSDYRDFRVHGPRMRIDNLSAPSGGFVARVSVAVTTVDRRPGRRAIFPAADIAFASVFAVPSEGGTGSSEDPAAATAVAQHAPSPTSTSQ